MQLVTGTNKFRQEIDVNRTAMTALKKCFLQIADPYIQYT